MELWLKGFVRTIHEENLILRAAGAEVHAEAREKLLERLVEAAESFSNQTIDVDEAAKLTGWDHETIRRKVRRGELTDLRDNKKAPIRILRYELERLGTKTPSPQSGSYDVQHDLERLSRRGRK